MISNMKEIHNNINRKEFLNILLFSLAYGVNGCSYKRANSIIRGEKIFFPPLLLKRLPKQWVFKNFQDENNFNPLKYFYLNSVDFISITDGWLDVFPYSEIPEINTQNYTNKYGSHTNKFINNLNRSYLNKVLPIGVSPWVMIFRNSPNLMEKANKSWDVLLESDLNQQIIMPNSPKFIINLMEVTGNLNNLKKLRQNIKTYDDRNAINWIVSGKAKVAILPLQRCIKSIFQDPRLSIALPEIGAPLNWSLVIKTPQSTEDFPDNWLTNSWDSPNSSLLALDGWITPLIYEEFYEKFMLLRRSSKEKVLPPISSWNKCWSLPILSSSDKKNYKEIWYSSTP